MSSDQVRYLLHVCCAPCASASIERLTERGEDVTLFFSNSNIYPHQEYLRRLAEVERLARIFSVPLIEDIYDHESWLRWVSGLEDEPEKGRRCDRCFAYSLRRTAEKAEELGMQQFSTTLSISPHKRSASLFAAAEGLDGFVPDDFKKKNGFARSIALSREFELYRQDYCGCEFSKRASQRHHTRSQ
ncbi:MAG: epoxyqueuosine reductase QueH [Spirochaetia bacterium]|nr:epoxyqueuosine reductase QueH [Spirochaetia bacterium]